MSKLMGTLLTIGALIALGSGSAIPMWEFLSRGEKMSHLYSMFAKQVSAHCRSTANELPITLCKRDLLVYGIGRLERMSDAHIDSMDPYQRGVNDLIWDSMVEGHATKPAKRLHHHAIAATSTESAAASLIREPSGPYERNPLFDDASSSGASQLAGGSQQHQQQDSYQANDRLNEAYASDMDAIYTVSPAATGSGSSSSNGAGSAIYLSGPMIIRVRPDGTPVEEDGSRVLPRDDDREAMTLGRVKLPTVQQIATEFGGDDAATAVESSSSSSIRSHYRTAVRNY